MINRRPKFPEAKARQALKLAKEFGENVRIVIKPDGEVEIAAGPAIFEPTLKPKREIVL